MKLKLNNKYSLNIPDGYKKIKQTRPSEIDVELPADIQVFQKITSNSNNIAMIFEIPEEDAMPYDDQQIIDGIHDNLEENQGLIEVGTSENNDGDRFAYSIVKTVNTPSGVLYYLRMNIFNTSGNTYELQASFEETDTTGVRDATVFALARKDNLVEVTDEGTKGWNIDPYDEDYTKGIPMNLSEKKELDDMFPEHPLSQAREFVNEIISEKVYKMDKAKILIKDGLGKAKGIAVNVLDQNDDNVFNKDDIAILADKTTDKLKTFAQYAADSALETQRELERSLLSPIFADDLNNSDFKMPKLIRIVDRDKRHENSEVCKGSIGHWTTKTALNIVNVYSNKIDDFGLTFYPDRSSELYYVDPADRNTYIALDEYFDYMKQARIAELQKIAQDLGAKHFKVTYKEEKKSFHKSKKNAKATGKAGVVITQNAVLNAESNIDEKTFSTIEIAAELSFTGHDPVEPQIKYLQHDADIKSLVDMRLCEKDAFTNKKCTLKLSKSSGLKENDAVKIDATLKALKINGNATVASEASREARSYLEYEIDF